MQMELSEIDFCFDDAPAAQTRNFKLELGDLYYFYL